MEPGIQEAGRASADQRSSPAPSSSSPPTSSTRHQGALTLVDEVGAGNGTLPLPDNHHSHAKDRPVSGIVPPYWRHYRAVSRASQISVDGPPAITLEDHTEDPDSDTSRGLWARSVTIDDHVVVQGENGVGAYVVWNCKIQTLEVSLRRELYDPRLKLVRSLREARWYPG
jgi:hypothetical protein